MYPALCRTNAVLAVLYVMDRPSGPGSWKWYEASFQSRRDVVIDQIRRESASSGPDRRHCKELMWPSRTRSRTARVPFQCLEPTMSMLTAPLVVDTPRL